MKHFLVVLLVLSFGWTHAQSASQESTPRERAGYRGLVKRVVIEEEREDVPRRIRQELHYEELGNPVELIYYSYDFMEGTLRSKTITRFGDQGQVLVRETLDPEGSVLSQVLYRYNDQGKVAEQITYDATGAITAREAFTYDSSGKVTREENYRGANLYRYNELTYDSSGNLLTRERSDGEGTLLESRAYSDNGMFFEETEYDEAGNVEGRSTAQLDERGNFVELVGYDAEGNLEDQTAFVYDENGLVLEQIFSSTVMNSPVKTVTRYAYSFDEQGNWVQRQQAEDVELGMFDSSSVMETLYRTIEYY